MSFVTNDASRRGKRARMYNLNKEQSSTSSVGGAALKSFTPTPAAGPTPDTVTLGSQNTTSINIVGKHPQNSYAHSSDGTGKRFSEDGELFAALEPFLINYIGPGYLKFTSPVAIQTFLEEVNFKHDVTFDGNVTANGAFSPTELNVDEINAKSADDAALSVFLWEDIAVGSIYIGSANDNYIQLGGGAISTPTNEVAVLGNLTVSGKVTSSNVTDDQHLFTDHSSGDIIIGNNTAGTADVLLRTFDGSNIISAYGIGDVVLESRGTGTATVSTADGTVNISSVRLDVSHSNLVRLFSNTLDIEMTDEATITAGNVLNLTTAASNTDINVESGTGDINLTPTGAGRVVAATNIHSPGISFDSGTNLLDFYERGTFTPTIGGEGSNLFTMLTQDARYCRIGDVVHFTLTIAWTDHNSATAGSTVQLTGFPYRAYAEAFDRKYMHLIQNSSGLNLADEYTASLQMTQGTTTAEARKQIATTGSQSPITVSETQTSGFFLITSFYITDGL